MIVLDVDLTPELEQEGRARDLIRLVQQARRDADLAVTDRIELRDHGRRDVDRRRARPRGADRRRDARRRDHDRRDRVGYPRDRGPAAIESSAPPPPPGGLQAMAATKKTPAKKAPAKKAPAKKAARTTAATKAPAKKAPAKKAPAKKAPAKAARCRPGHRQRRCRRHPRAAREDEGRHHLHQGLRRQVPQGPARPADRGARTPCSARRTGWRTRPTR